MRFCSRCGAPLRLVTVDGIQRERCSNCAAIAFRNPTPVGLAVIEHDEQLVLVRRAIDPLCGYWAPPGGYVECGESVPEAVVREAREETALLIEVDGLIGAYSHADVDVIILAYRARSIGGQPRAGDDAADLGLFARGKLPRQQAPATGTATDRWFYQVIQDVTAAWR